MRGRLQRIELAGVPPCPCHPSGCLPIVGVRRFGGIAVGAYLFCLAPAGSLGPQQLASMVLCMTFARSMDRDLPLPLSFGRLTFGFSLPSFMFGRLTLEVVQEHRELLFESAGATIGPRW